MKDLKTTRHLYLDGPFTVATVEKALKKEIARVGDIYRTALRLLGEKGIEKQPPLVTDVFERLTRGNQALVDGEPFAMLKSVEELQQIKGRWSSTVGKLY